MRSGVEHFIDYARFDTVEHPGEDELDRLPDDAEDGDCNQQSDNRIGLGKAEVDASSSRKHRQTGPPIGACMIAICNQSSASDFLTHSNAEDRNQLIAEKADDRRDDNRSKMCHRLRMKEAVNCLIQG